MAGVRHRGKIVGRRKSVGSFASILRRMKRFGLNQAWMDSCDQNWLQSVLNRPEPKLTLICYPRKKKTTTTAMSPSTSTLASQQSLEAFSTRMEKLDLKEGSDQYQTTRGSDIFDTQQDKLSSDIATTSTSMPQGVHLFLFNVCVYISNN
ncbi:PREDICTED: uncharacterized protein LOC104717696 [Camelina sativa]|uniref:Uncharacterized protein LOC104717696 n=1 Tax=Camelina sativa TaxID=90675 RepID=A0ABM0TZD4_CAMSA|nr:PREDICTED: uncharacterized protein LOC104717696 [Camelina sativa]